MSALLLLALPSALALRGGPDAFGYAFVDSTEADGPVFSWEDIAATGTSVDLPDDGELRLTLPFAFHLYGRAHHSVSFGDGALAFGPAWGLDNRNACLPAENPAGSDALVLALWDDLAMDEADAVTWEVRGAAPARRLLIQVDGAPHYGGTTRFSFQVALEEQGARILLQYLAVEGTDAFAGGLSATVGIQDGEGTALEYSCEGSALLTDRLAVLFDAACEDADGDGAGPCDGDCDDTDPLLGPFAPERDDGLDQDCDGLTDEDFVAPGDVVFAELLPDSLAVDDEDGEWFELCNVSDRPLDLGGWTLQDDEGGVVLDGPIALPVGGRALLAATADPTVNGNLPAVDGVFDWWAFHMDNAGDGLTLALAGAPIDEVAYEVPAWAVIEGRALYLDPGYHDATANDSPLPWCATLAGPAWDYGGQGTGDWGTPGADNPVGLCCHDDDADGWDVCDGDCDDTDARRYPGNPEVQDLVDNDCDGIADQDWIPDGAVVVTEFMDDPAAVEAGLGEWFELANVGDTALNLRGWRVTDDLGDGFEIEEDLILDPGALALLAVAGEAALNGGLPPVDYVYDYDAFPLRSYDDDDIQLVAGERLIDRVAWSNVAPWPSEPGRSLYLCPEAWDTASDDALANWGLTPADPAFSYGTEAGDWGTPGDDNPADLDEDGDGTPRCAGDCDDADPAVGPAAAEDCANGLDDDCDGFADADDPACAAETGGPPPGDSADGGCGGCGARGGRGTACMLAFLALAAVRRRA